MSELRKANYDAVFFVTLTVVGWVDVFTRKQYCEELVKNIQYCQQHKGLELYAYVIMSNHMHWVAAQKQGVLNHLLRDFKSYTAKQMLAMIYDNPQESRRDWMKVVFQYNAKFQKQHAENMFWQKTNHPIDCFNQKVLWQKIKYIHQNPVRAGWVAEPGHWWYSSANPRSPIVVMEL
ncbi:MAG: transposase [Chitinophagaceae bacterium]|nr:MAG: transposase [Chitinophagaceae bacterium]